jgi:hypothetical protein
MKLTITTNPWVPPAVAQASDGASTAEDLWEAEARAATFSPGLDAWALLARLRAYVGLRVIVHAGAPVVVMLDGEGPYPMRAFCREVVTRIDRAGRVRAFVVVEEVEVIRSLRGYDGRARYLVEDGGRLLLDVADLCGIATDEP